MHKHAREEPGQDGRLPHSPCTRSRTARKHAEDRDQDRTCRRHRAVQGPRSWGEACLMLDGLLTASWRKGRRKPWERPRSATCAPQAFDPVLQFDGRRIFKLLTRIQLCNIQISFMV